MGSGRWERALNSLVARRAPTGAGIKKEQTICRLLYRDPGTGWRKMGVKMFVLPK